MVIFAALLVMVGIIVAGNTVGNGIQIAADAIIQAIENDIVEYNLDEVGDDEKNGALH